MSSYPDLTKLALKRVTESLSGDDLTKEEQRLLSESVGFVLWEWWRRSQEAEGDTLTAFKEIYQDEFDRAVDHLVAGFEMTRCISRCDYVGATQALLKLVN